MDSAETETQQGESAWRPVVACAASLARGVLHHVGAAYDWAHVERTVAHAEAIVDALGDDTIDRELVVLGCMLYDTVNPRYASSIFSTPEALASSYIDYLTDRAHLRDRPERLAKLDCILQRAAVDNGDPSSTVTPPDAGGTRDETSFVELNVVCDAHRLDSLGAVGVARACMLGAGRGWTLVGPRTPSVAEWIDAGRPALRPDGTVAAYLYGCVLAGPRFVLATVPARVMAQPLVAQLESHLDALIVQARGRRQGPPPNN